MSNLGQNLTVRLGVLVLVLLACAALLAGPRLAARSGAIPPGQGTGDNRPAGIYRGVLPVAQFDVSPPSVRFLNRPSCRTPSARTSGRTPASSCMARRAATPPAHSEPGSTTLLLGQAATTAAITAALITAVAQQGPEDTLLFYFAGHGLGDPAEGVELKTADDEFSRDQLLPILTGRHYPPNPTVILLDCCYADAFRGQPSTPPPAGAAAPPIPNIQALYATGADDPAFEARDQGRFTTAVVETLRDNLALWRLPLDLAPWLPEVTRRMNGEDPAPAERGHALLVGVPFPETHLTQEPSRA